MKNFVQKKLKDQKGMTLIELLAVIVIIAIIAAIAIPAIGNLIENSRNGAVKADYQNAIAAANLYFTDNSSAAAATVTVEKLLSESYLDDKGSLANGVTITKAQGGNTITGATTDGKYAIKTAITNSNLGKIKNKDFKGTDIAYTAPAGG